MKSYKNNSIFQGWLQFFDDRGSEWRAEKKDHYWNFYYRSKDQDSFIFWGVLSKKSKRESLKAMLDRFLETQFAYEDSK